MRSKPRERKNAYGKTNSPGPLSENVRDAVSGVCHDLAMPGLDAKALTDLGAEIIALKLPPRASQK